jgi:uncharacterized membrane protein
VIGLRRGVQVGLWLPATPYLAAALALGLLVPSTGPTSTPASPMASASVLAILTSVASGMMALTGIVFSVIFLAIQFGASTYSPRLTNELTRRPVLAHALGVFSGTFLYSVVAIHTVDRTGGTGVARIVVWIALAWLLASVVLLVVVVAWPQRMTLAHVLDEFGHKGSDAVARLFQPLGDGEDGARSSEDRTVPAGAAVTQEIEHRGRVSYFQACKEDVLVEAARRAGGVIVVLRAPGDPLAPGATVAVVVGAERAVSARLVRRGLTVGRARRLEHDPAYALRLLVDVAIRALSPAINDPTTAVEALDEIEQLLIVFGRSRFDQVRLRDARGQVRLVCAAAPTWQDVLALALVEIQQYGRDAVQVERRMGALLRRLLAELPPARRPPVERLVQRRAVVLSDAFAHEDDRDHAAAFDPQGLGHTVPVS